MSASILKYTTTSTTDNSNDNSNSELLSAKSISLKPYNDYYNNINNITPITSSSYKTFSFEYKLHHDELGINNIMTTRTVFNLFERARTDILGGPKVLAESSSSSSLRTTSSNDIIKYYVGRITDYHYCNNIPKVIVEKLDQGPIDISVITQCIQIGDSMCDFQQQIVCRGSNASLLLLAKANVLVVSVNGDTGQSAPYPKNVLKMFEITNV
jgi:acyl-CoA thioesterase FadM